MGDRICSAEGCEKSELRARGMCTAHYERWLRAGKPFNRIITCIACAAERMCAPKGGLPKLCESCEKNLAWCPGCEQVLARARFSKSAKTRLGLYGICKACHLARHRLRKYGVEAADIASLMRNQEGLCCICGERLGRQFNVDHCHATGRARGLLCGPCNRGLGCFLDNPRRVEAALAYLVKHSKEGDGALQGPPGLAPRRFP